MNVLEVFGLLAFVVAACWWGVLPRLRKLAWGSGFIANVSVLLGIIAGAILASILGCRNSISCPSLRCAS